MSLRRVRKTRAGGTKRWRVWLRTTAQDRRKEKWFGEGWLALKKIPGRRYKTIRSTINLKKENEEKLSRPQVEREKEGK